MLLRFGDLFSGAGGLSLGACVAQVVDVHGQRWRLAPAWAVDADGDACATYRLNLHGDEAQADVRQADLRTVEASALAPVDVMLCGFPCNDFSAIGEFRGMRGRYGALYLEAVRVLRDLRPMAFIAENVAGLSASHGGRALRQVIHDFAKSGYQVTAHLFRLEDYGLPQARHRIFLVGVRGDLRRRFRVPAPESAGLLTAGEALGRPFDGLRWNDETIAIRPLTRERIRHIRPGETLWDAQEREDFPDRFRIAADAQRRFQTIYRRLDRNRVAWTIVAAGGGGTRPCHWEEPRPLTNRELARLQGFPDAFRFMGGRDSVRRQIGMAVPPPAARVIVEALLRTLARIPYPEVAPNVEVAEGRLPRGRPPRLEAQSGPERASRYRARRVTENQAIAEVIERALNDRMLDLRSVDLEVLEGFLARTLKRRPQPQRRSVTEGALSVRWVAQIEGETRSQRHRRRLGQELEVAKTVIAKLASVGLLDELLPDEGARESVRRFLARERGRGKKVTACSGASLVEVAA